MPQYKHLVDEEGRPLQMFVMGGDDNDEPKRVIPVVDLLSNNIIQAMPEIQAEELRQKGRLV